MKYSEFKSKYKIDLNEQQESALLNVEGEILLLAVPGSGKTTVLVSRLGYMIFCENIKPESILTVTYTVAATDDMRKRFETKFGSGYVKRLEFRTINGIAQKILQYYGEITGKKPFRVADKEAVNIVKQVFHSITGQFATENDIKNVQTAITYVKNMRLEESEIKTLKVEVEDFPMLYAAYNKELRARALIDYDDQMVYALRILEKFPKVLNHFQEKYRYFCVDEAQDTSKIQHDMINLLAGRSRNLFMVGDEDQSIYGFRAAYPEALVHFEQVHSEAKVLLMESNYRSGQKIVAAADKFIQCNRSRHEKHMKAVRALEGQISQIPVKTRQYQYRYLSKVAQNCDEETVVLYRNNESALPLIDILDRKKISYQLKKSEMTFFSHPIVNDICDFMRLAINPYDKEAFGHIYYKVGAGITKAAALSAMAANDKERTLLDAVAGCSDVSAYTRKQCKALSTHFRNMKNEDAGKAVYRVLHYMGYEAYMEDHGFDSGKAEILQIIAYQEENPESFLDRLERLREIVSNGNTDYQSKFILSTIHSSKGLEYERVYMADMLNGILPSVNEPKGNHVKQEDIDAYEEERRMYYVGMTRAKNKLYIFTFHDAETSQFSKNVFQTDKKRKVNPATKRTVVNLANNPYKRKKNNVAVQRESLAEYEMGVIVYHKKYGRGVIVQKDENVAEILFDHEAVSRKIALDIAVSNGILKQDE